MRRLQAKTRTRVAWVTLLASTLPPDAGTTVSQAQNSLTETTGKERYQAIKAVDVFDILDQPLEEGYYSVSGLSPECTGLTNTTAKFPGSVG